VIERPTVRWTARVLSYGTLLSAACFLVGLLLSISARDAAGDEGQGLEAVLRSVMSLQPWGWSMLGVLVLLSTPVAGLVSTAVELRSLQPRGALLALAVIGLLGLAVIAAVVAG
jgi:hypothetical protein